MHNCTEFFEIYFACAKSGAIFVPINNLLKQKELMHIFEYIKPRFLILDKDFTGVIQSILPDLKSIEFPISLNDDSAGFMNYSELADQGDNAEPNVKISG